MANHTDIADIVKTTSQFLLFLWNKSHLDESWQRSIDWRAPDAIKKEDEREDKCVTS